MLWILFAPFWLALGLLFAVIIVPFLLLRAAFKLLAALLVLPFVLVFGVLGLLFGFLALFFVILIPLLPLAIVAFFIWCMVRLASRPAVSH